MSRVSKKSGCLIALGVAFALFVVAAVGVVVFIKRQESRDAAPLPDVELPVGSAPLPGDQMYFDSDRTGNFELFTMGHDGSSPKQITDDPEFDSWWPRLSPDRTRLLFYRSPVGKHDLDFTVTSLWMANADGSGVVEVLPVAAHGWWQQGHAEWSPDAEHLVMFGGSRINPQIYVTDELGRDPEARTDRGGTNIDPSWSPDGNTIYFIGCPGSICTEGDYEVYSVGARGDRDATRITENDRRDQDPYMSPDATQLAWLVQTSSRGPAGAWNIDVADARGRDAKTVPDDGNITSLPRWSADSAQIFTHRLVYGARAKFEIVVMKPDGSGLTTLTDGQPGNNEYPSP